MSPATITTLSLLIFFMLSAASVITGINNPILLLNENQILYLFSTSAQVLSGVYGLTLTGFIFFRNELSREEFNDDTLIEAVTSLKERYYKLLLFITTISIFTILMANLVISHEGDKQNSVTTVIINITQSAFIVSLFVIAYFIFDVISPQRIEKASKKLQQQVDPYEAKEEKGSLESFLKNYNSIEQLLVQYGNDHQVVFSSSIEVDYKYRRRISNIRLAEILFKSKYIDERLFSDLRDLITLRNSIIHGAEPVVSSKIVEVSNKILKELNIALTRG